ncbi:MAG: hypothetical protein MZV64_49225 [Ignavibacteriales bacterium]|nr:hypothetical protein [Ignavibacteriales bacterium]
MMRKRPVSRPPHRQRSTATAQMTGRIPSRNAVNSTPCLSMPRKPVIIARSRWL